MHLVYTIAQRPISSQRIVASPACRPIAPPPMNPLTSQALSPSIISVFRISVSLLVQSPMPPFAFLYDRINLLQRPTRLAICSLRERRLIHYAEVDQTYEI